MSTGGEKRSRKRGFWKRAAAATRSGLRRYPNQLVRSFKKQIEDATETRQVEIGAHGSAGATITPGNEGGEVGATRARSLDAGAASAGDAAKRLIASKFGWPRMPQEPLAASWLGHATALVRIGDLTVLTDPVLSGRIGPRVAGRTMGVSRLMGAPTGSPPPIDVIVISHAHFDHLDRPTLRKLANPRTTVITARHTGRLIPSGFGDVIEVDWGQSVGHGGVEFAAIKPQHWGARTAWDRHRGFNAYMMSTSRQSVLFAGDTAATDAFKDLNPSLAIFGIGAYSPWEHMHATPEQVWEMFSMSRARWLMPVHHSTFELSDEHVDEPLQRLLAAAGTDEPRVVARTPGDVWVGK